MRSDRLHATPGLGAAAVVFAAFAAPSALVASGCLVVDRAHLDSLANDGGTQQGMDGSTTERDAGADAGADDVLRLVDRCGDNAADYVVLEDSTGERLRVDTRGLTSQISGCGSQMAPGNEGFIAIDVQGGDRWHFHVAPDSSEAGMGRDPFLYLLRAETGSCDSRNCRYRSDACTGPGDEHFGFEANEPGRWYLGIDDRNPGGGVYQIEAIRLFCDDGVRGHGEPCDGSGTCNSQCREVLGAERPTEVEANDNLIEANFVELPATNEVTISGAIGGDLCTYPDVYNVRMPTAGAGLRVEVRKSDGTVCDNPSVTPFDIILRTAAGETRAGPQTSGTTGCAELRVDGLDMASYFIFLEHDEPFDTVQTYQLYIQVIP